MNATCTKAVRLAFVEAFIEDMIASIVEPMLLPKIIAALNSQLRELFAAIVKTIAVMAEEECIKAVMKIPINTPIKIPKTPQFEMAERILVV